MKILFSILLVGLFAGAKCNGQGNGQQQSWVDQLKKTPVDQIEPGLSQTNFAQWFADLVKPNQIDYEIQECVDENPARAESQERLLCVVAYTKPPQPHWNRWIQLRFVVGVSVPSGKAGTRAEVKPVACRFLGGSEGPSNPAMKRPTRMISKLSELEKLLHGSATYPNP
jgi:hypothetical protein